MTSVKRLDQGELRLGSRARIRQPGLPPAVWEVTDLVPGEGFSWAATGPGIRTIGHHRFAPAPDGTVKLTLGLEQTGPLAGVMRALLTGRTKRFLRLEVDVAGLHPDGVGDELVHQADHGARVRLGQDRLLRPVRGRPRRSALQSLLDERVDLPPPGARAVL